MSLSERSNMLSLKDTIRSSFLFPGKWGIIPFPVGGRVASVVSGMKPAWKYNAVRVLGVASCCAVWVPRGHVRDAQFSVAIANRVVALRDLSSVLLFVSPTASCESYWCIRVLG
jgi:hypothetical protein